MLNLVYEAIDAGGRSVHDVMEAPSLKEGAESLRRKGLMVTHIEHAHSEDIRRASAATGDDGTARLPLKVLMILTRQMAMLLASGSAVVPALAAIARQMTKPMHAHLIRQIQLLVEEGTSLTDTLRRYPGAFDPIYCALIAAGESSATLPDMFKRLASLLGKRREIRNRVLGAMAYPALLTCLASGIVCVLLFFVMPRFAVMFETLHMPLPTSTAIMLKVARFVREYWFVPLAGVVGVVTAVVFFTRTDAGRQWMSDIQVRIPLYGRLATRLIQGQVFRVLGMLIESHVSILESMDLARRVTRNRRYQAMFDRLESAVTSGGGLGSAMEASGLVPPALCQVVCTGEQSGNLGTAITYAANVLDEENDELVQTLTKLVEPVILIAIGLVVGTVAVSLFMPLFDMTSAVH